MSLKQRVASLSAKQAAEQRRSLKQADQLRSDRTRGGQRKKRAQGPRFPTEAKLNAALGQTDDLQLHFAAKQQVLACTQGGMERINRIRACHYGRRCNDSFCYHCATLPRTNGKGRPPTSHDLRFGGFHFNRSEEALYDIDLPELFRHRNFINRGAQWMSHDFIGYPSENIFAVTIDHSLLNMIGSNLQKESKDERDQLKPVIKTHFPDGFYRGKFEYAIRMADEVGTVFPASKTPSVTVGGQIGHLRAALFHSHGLLYAPGFSKNEVRRLLQQHYPGANRVCVRNITESFKDENGIERHGIWGWAQYGSKEWIVLDFEDDNITALEEAIELNKTWSRQSMNIRIGGPRKLDLRPRWLAEVHPGFAETFHEIASQEGWYDPEHPFFEIAITNPLETELSEHEWNSLLPSELPEAPDCISDHDSVSCFDHSNQHIDTECCRDHVKDTKPSHDSHTQSFFSSEQAFLYFWNMKANIASLLQVIWISLLSNLHTSTPINLIFHNHNKIGNWFRLIHAIFEANPLKIFKKNIDIKIRSASIRKSDRPP